MNKTERLNKAYNYLRSMGVVHTQKEVAEKLGTSAGNVSNALRGNPVFQSDHFLLRFNLAFDNIFNTEWLLKGDGEMLSTKHSLTSHGDNSPNINGNKNVITDNGVLTKALDEISALRVALSDAVKANQDALRINQENTSRLFAIIERMQNSKT